MTKLRIQKYLSQQGILSRRKAEQALLAGHITVNGNVVTELGTQIDPECDIVEVADSVLQYRFYHGTCRYSFRENWLASLLAHTIWDDFRMIVIPDHILNKKVGVCNQINIVFQELLRKNNMRFRTVGLNNHLFTEVYLHDHWQVFDADYEPNFERRIKTVLAMR